MIFSSLKDARHIDSLLGRLSDALPGFPISKMLAAFATAFVQDARFLTLQVGDGETYGDRLLPQSVEGREELSSPNRYEVTCLSPDAYILPEALEGQSAQIKIAVNATRVPGLGEPVKIIRCGLITHVDILPSDGGFARYKLTIESPLALLEHRRTSRVFQDILVHNIVRQILDEHCADNSAIGSILNVQFLLRKQYKPRSYCNQYRESDLEFIHRILFEESLSYRWEHEPGITPRCRLIVFDDPYDLPQAAQASVRFHRAEATEKEDSLTEWTESRSIGPSKTSLHSFNYKTAQTEKTTANGRPVLLGKKNEKDRDLPAESTLEDFDAQTLYYGKDDQDLSRYATLRQNVYDRKKSSYHAVGNLRQIIAGEYFDLTGHPGYDMLSKEEREFAVCELEFSAHNNLPSLSSYLSPLQDVPPESDKNKDAPYRVHLSLRKRGQPLAPAYAHTQHARPNANGVQTATVVGPAGEEVYTDDRGRIKIQFHWQRPKEHPIVGANFNECSSCWLRVAYPSAGVNWGTQYIPRIGQEVLVSFIENDIDRPIVTGVIHNGTHPTPWFSGTGKLPQNRTLSGVKTKEHHGRQYGELLFDDTKDEVRTKLSSEHGKTQLNQGFLIHPRKDGVGEPRGDGAELRTDRHAAIRAAEGLLLSTEAKPEAVGKQLDRKAAQAQLESARTAAQELAKLAEHQKADVLEIGPETRDDEGKKQDKTPKGHLDHMVEAVKAWEAGTNTDPKAKTATEEQDGKQALLLASAVDGLSLTTPEAMILTSGANLDTISLRDTQQTTLRRWIHNAAKKISLFVLGVKGKVNLKLITANGHAQLHAQTGDVEVIGEQNVRLHALKKQILVAAGEEALITCGGAYIKLKDGNIDIHCPGTLSFRSANSSYSGPAEMWVKGETPAPGTLNICIECLRRAAHIAAMTVEI